MRRKWIVYLLTFSLALNVATAATFVFFWRQSQTLASVSVGQKSIRGFLQEDLGLTSEKSNQILSQIDRSKQEAAALRALMDSKRSEMIGLLTSTSVNKDDVREKMEEVSRIQGKIRSAAVTTVITILESLPPESRDRFRAYLQARGRACDVCCPPNPEVGRAVMGE
jgi:Spy/CpxP family protein refolding chaperone